jgi:DNA invertase Pin-like site-specific DNA recombinase
VKCIAYIRVSTDKQDLDNQKLSILEYARKHDLTVSDFIEVRLSTRKSTHDRKIENVREVLQKNDILIVSELSRLGRSVGQVITLIDDLVKTGVRIVSIKEGIDLNGKRDMQSKVMVTLFTLFAEIERDLISERTKQGLAW